MRVIALLLSVLLVAGCSSNSANESRDNASQAAAQAEPGEPGYVEEDPRLAQLVGKPGPAVAFRTLDGRQIDLASSLGKRPIYLKLWATYCIPCRVQMPKFERIYGQFKDRVEVVAVDVGFGEDAAKVQSFARDHGLTMPMAIDDGSLAAWLGMDGTPVHLLINRDGRVAFAGHQDGKPLDDALEQVVTAPSSGNVSAGAKVVRTDAIKTGAVVPMLQTVDSQGRIGALHLTKGGPTALLLTSAWCETYLADLEPKRALACRHGREAVQRLSKLGKGTWQVIVSHLWTKPSDLGSVQHVMGSALPVLMDHNGDVFRAFGIQQFPMIAIIGKDGRLQRVVPADGDVAQVEAALRGPGPTV